ncbi:MAG: carbohydrate binding domain-containing protein [Chitinispirillaceae bacterium]
MGNLKRLSLLFLTVLALFTASDAQRITVQGNRFYVGENPIFMLGANTPWDRWNDFGHSFNYDWWNNHFEQMHQSGINNTRVWISCSGENDSPGIDATGHVTGATDQFWSDVGDLFEIAQNNQIYLMIALISFDHTKEQRNFDRWRLMYQSPENRQSFVDNYAVPFVERFGDNPYFWSIDVGNELDWVHENHDVPIEDVFDLVARVANGVHANSEVLVTLGTGAGPKYLSPTYGEQNWYSDEVLGELQPGAYLDFYNNHYYEWMKEWFSTPFDMGPDDWEISEKPCVIGEYSGLGHGDGYSPAECLEKAYDLGWQGVMPWTSNGVDVHGTLSDFGPAFSSFSEAHYDLVFPSSTPNPGPFTLSITQPEGGEITASPSKELYEKGEDVTLTATPREGGAFMKWTGDASGTKPSVTITVNRNMNVSALFAAAGDVISNGTFDDGMTDWNLGQYESGSATASVQDGACQIAIADGGTEIWHVQLIQNGLTLAEDQTYVFSFDASADSEREIFVAVGESGGAYTKYAEQTVTLTSETQTFTFEFTPSAANINARAEFNIGMAAGTVTLDNVSIRSAASSPVLRSVKPTRPTGKTYSLKSSTLQFNVNPGDYVRANGFTLSGARVFSFEGRAADGMISVPLKNMASSAIIVRGTSGGKDFSFRVINNR